MQRIIHGCNLFHNNVPIMEDISPKIHLQIKHCKTTVDFPLSLSSKSDSCVKSRVYNESTNAHKLFKNTCVLFWNTLHLWSVLLFSRLSFSIFKLAWTVMFPMERACPGQSSSERTGRERLFWEQRGKFYQAMKQERFKMILIKWNTSFQNWFAS